MDHNDQHAIEDLFSKLAEVGRRSPPLDTESELFIRQKIAAQPSAPYYMAQTVLMQERALEAAQARIQELETQVANSRPASGGLFGGLFGGSEPANARPLGAVSGAERPDHASSRELTAGIAEQPQRSGGFLAGAAQTAMGVAGGAFLASALGGMLGTDKAKAAAAEPAHDDSDDLNGGLNDIF